MESYKTTTRAETLRKYMGWYLYLTESKRNPATPIAQSTEPKELTEKIPVRLLTCLPFTSLPICRSLPPRLRRYLI